MTTDLQTRIAAIKAECEEILRLSEKATAGPWSPDEKFVDSAGRGPEIAMCNGYGRESNAAFIAHARNVSPAMARVVIDCIRWFTNMEDESALEDIANQWEGK